MYGLVPYNLSPIQQGIQFGHAVVEYSELYRNTKAYKKWVKKWKTFIILNGGTTNKDEDNFGTLNKHLATLLEYNILAAYFFEPDLGDQLTAAVFLVDERVFLPEKYPDEDEEYVLFLREFLKQFKLA